MIAKFFAKDLEFVDDIELTAVADLSRERADAFAEEY